MNTEENNDVKKEGNDVPVMNRREALKKTGYAVFSAATMMLLLNKPDKALPQSPPGGGGDGGGTPPPGGSRKGEPSSPGRQRKY